MSSEIELKPCPACGGVSSVATWSEDDTIYKMECLLCGMCGPFESSEKEAAKAWNSLPQREDIERLNREADFLAERLHSAGVPCPGDGEKFDPYGECQQNGWPCVACFREWARQQTQKEKNDGKE